MEALYHTEASQQLLFYSFTFNWKILCRFRIPWSNYSRPAPVQPSAKLWLQIRVQRQFGDFSNGTGNYGGGDLWRVLL